MHLSPFSTNLATLKHTSNRLNIEKDPYIQSLCYQLSHKAPGTPDMCAQTRDCPLQTNG
ncbi:hypothetical protein GYMLUDRAFT_161337 [Collybiopsis luxurians FD-317 M1]|nr:hypothetical protein GYMLUDRAFT_161337 [Collybiopsis luxurians FD-317 M1]